MRVCIDPGHGGSDPGAVSGDYLEKNYTLGVSLNLKTLLEKIGIEVIMTRTDDEDLKNEQRVKRIISSGADVCLSIHFNASNGLGKGCETIYQINNLDSQKLANIILNTIGELDIHKRKSYSKASESNPDSDFYFILRRTIPINTAIIECLFIDNRDDKIFLSRNNALEDLSQKIAKGIIEYFGIEEPASNHWANPYLEELKNMGIVEGDYNPNDIPTWGELSALIIKTVTYIEDHKNKSSI